MIKVDDDYYIDSDKMNWILCVRVHNIKRDTYDIKPVTYHPSIVSVINKIKTLREKDIEECKTLDDYIEKLTKIEEKFKHDINNMKKVEGLDESN